MDWTHTPLHRTKDPGWYFITAGTYKKAPFLLDERRRESLIDLIWSCATQMNLIVQAWVVLSNHYHLMLQAAQTSNIPLLAKRVHSNQRAGSQRARRHAWPQGLVPVLGPIH